MTIDDVWRAICENPEDDQLRLTYADLIEEADPDHAWLIREQIRRSTLERSYRAGIMPRGEIHRVRKSDHERRLLDRRKTEWARNLMRFVAYGRANNIVFRRGFPVFIEVHPHIFLEYADLLFRLAPLRHIRISANFDEDGVRHPVPVAEILASPYLQRLDSFGFEDLKIPWQASELIAASPHLTRCQWLGFAADAHVNPVPLIEGELTRKMLYIKINLNCFDPIGEYPEDEETLGTSYAGVTHTRFGKRGRAYEEKYGYIPWLHPSQNCVDWEDAVFYVQRGDLPKFPAGSLPPKPEWYDVPLQYIPRSPW